jgi:hypothetical protein
MINSGLVPGAACVAVMMRRHFNIDLNDQQTNKLWVEVRKDLLSNGRFMSVLKAQRSYFGKVDHDVELHFYESLGMVMGKREWPTVKDSSAQLKEFQDNVRSYFAEHGYQLAVLPINRKAG